MDALLLIFPLVLLVLFVQRSDQQRRIALLARHLGAFRIEPQMQQLTEGYLRALGTGDTAQAAPVWASLAATETALQTELAQLAASLAPVWGEQVRVSRWPVDVPLATRFFPRIGFDFRALVALHAEGVARALRNDEELDRRDRAFRTTAELLLFQHSCHWFCRSRQRASARLLAQHRTGYTQVLDAVSPATRKAYESLTNG
jgi:hypothetical protein